MERWRRRVPSDRANQKVVEESQYRFALNSIPATANDSLRGSTWFAVATSTVVAIAIAFAFATDDHSRSSEGRDTFRCG